ncbi:MAG: SRPBCC domain-containing protein [Rhodobacter sp.]|nr:SRPBCC domain-containing protein [Rhodobacter sp.]
MTTIRKSIYLKASKATVWSFLTEIDKVKTWFHRYDTDLAAGRDYKIFGQESGKELGYGTVLTSDPHDLLEYTFAIGPMQGASSTVKWTLDDVPGGTRLNLEHSGLTDDAEGFGLILALDKGWDDHLNTLRDHAAAA